VIFREGDHVSGGIDARNGALRNPGGNFSGGFPIAAADALSNVLSDWSQKDRKTYSKLHYQPYLLSVPLEDQVRHTQFIRQTDKAGQALATMVRTDSFHAITEITWNALIQSM